MDDMKKTKAQLIAELNELRKRDAENDRVLMEHYLFENNPSGIGITNEKDKIIDANKALTDMLGYDKHDLSNMVLTDIYYNPADRKKLLKLIKREGKFENQEVQFVDKQGNLLWVSLSSRLINYKGENVFLTSLVNITDRKKAEEEKLKKEYFLESIINQSPSAIWISDEKGLVQVINPALKKFTHVKDEQIVGKYNVLEDPNLERQGLLPLIRSVYEEGKPVSFQCDWDGNDYPALNLRDTKSVSIEATMFPIHNKDGELTNVVLSWIEISKRKKTEEALQESEERFKIILKALPGGVFAHDLDGRFVLVNEKACENIGYTQEELLTMSVSDIDPSSITRNDRTRLWKNLKYGKTLRIESTHVRKDKSTYQAEIHLSAIEYRGEPILLAIVNDITNRKRAEEALLNEKLLSEDYINSLPGLFYVFDDERFIRWNTQWEKVTGYSEDELATMYGTDFFEGKDKKLLEERMRKVFHDGIADAEAELVTKDGRRIPYYFSGLRRDINGKNHLVGLGIDITERKKAEEALRESEERFRSLIDQSPFSIQIVDMTGKTIHVNAAWEKIWGVPWEEFVTYNYNILEDKQIVDLGIMPYLEKAYAGEAVSIPPMEYDVHKTSGVGNKRWVKAGIYPLKDDSGKVINVIIIQEDVTKRQKAEEGIRKFKTIFDNANYGGAISSLKGDLEYINPYFAEIHGYTSEELIGRNLSIFHNEDQLKSVMEINESLKVDGSYGPLEVWHMHKDGTVFPMLMTGIIVNDLQGNPHYMAATAIDISEQKRIEEEKSKLEEQYRQAQKVESIGRLAGGVAHDLNNLLAPIIGYGEMLKGNSIPDNERKEFIEEIVQAGLRARDLVRQLLAFSRKQILEYKTLDMNNVVTGFEKFLRRTIRENIEIEIILSSDIRTIRADIGQIEQVIMNLCVNAQDAMPEGGKLTLETGMVNLDESYTANHADIDVGEYVMLAVSDTGYGMDEETRKQIFEPFFSTKGEMGTGLGLATVYGIVKQHGGNIYIYSEPGNGTTFKIYLPGSRKELLESTDEKEPSGYHNGTETILLVEDNEQVRNLSSRILRSHGYSVLEAKNGEEAQAILEAQSKNIHLLLTDLIMPGMNGQELYSKAAEIVPELKVLYMSGYTDNVIVKHGVLDEGIQFIQKPFTVQALAAKVREVLHHQ